MRKVRKMTDQDFVQFADIVSNSFPEFNVNSKEEKEKFIENSIKLQNESTIMCYYGLFEEDEMLGGMRFHHFKMNMLSKEITAGGVGLVAVSAEHKKEKAARDMIEYFIRFYRDNGSPIAMLYPFRPDFYKKMGFGFGTSMCQFSVAPGSLPNYGSKKHVSILKPEDSEAMSLCYDKYYAKTNGLIARSKNAYSRYLNAPLTRVIGYKDEGEIKGYAIFEYKPKDHGNTTVIISELMFDSPEVLGELMTYFYRQSDQIKRIFINTQDENFRFFLEDPRNDSGNVFGDLYLEGNTQGTGIMYRVVDTKKLIEDLKEHNFNNQNLTLKITIKDDFLKENDGSLIVKFENGYPTIVNEGEYDAEISMKVCDFSSLIVGAVDFKSLHKYSRAEITNPNYLSTINTLFTPPTKPICTTLF